MGELLPHTILLLVDDTASLDLLKHLWGCSREEVSEEVRGGKMGHQNDKCRREFGVCTQFDRI